jgi:hypothetical protein
VIAVRPRIAATLALLALLLTPALARANGAAVIHDCLFNGRITGHYTQQDYAQALAQLDGDTAEYTDCPRLIRAAELAALAAARHHGHGSVGAAAAPAAAPAPPTQIEQAAIVHAHASGGGPVVLGGVPIRPGREQASISSTWDTLPDPLLATVIALLAGGAFFALRPVIRHVRARRLP